jgi:hypothetical protein
MTWAKVVQVFVYLKDNWHKYCGLVCIILLVYGLIKTFSPHVKIIETTKTVVDTESLKKAETEITRLNTDIQTMNKQMTQLKQVNKDYQSDLIIIETKYPDGRVEKRTERRVKDNSTTVVSSSGTATGTHANTSVSTQTNTVTTSTTTHTTTDMAKVTEKNPVPFWATIFGYQCKAKQCLIGQGINIGDSLSLFLLGSCKVTPTTSDKEWDTGGAVTIRY